MRAFADASVIDAGSADGAATDAASPRDGSLARDRAATDLTAADLATAGDVVVLADAILLNDSALANDSAVTTDSATATDAASSGDTAVPNDVGTASDAHSTEGTGSPEDAALSHDAAAEDAASSDAGGPPCAFPMTLDNDACRPVRVMLFADGSGAASTLMSALIGAGFDVVSGGIYHTWDGANPSLAGRDTILALQGTDYNNEFGGVAQVAIPSFVAAGGGLVRTEWAAWRRSGDAVTVLMPVVGTTGFVRTFTWSILDATHPLARGLENNFFSKASRANVDLRGQAVTVIESLDGSPIASYTKEHGGTSVHLNHDVTFTAVLEPECIALYLNAVWFSALP
ncbi:MAG: hypothetical protein ABIJ09_24390 [Pseudomonadota bacterium]